MMITSSQGNKLSDPEHRLMARKFRGMHTAAKQIKTRAHGDWVEPRREFIEENVAQKATTCSKNVIPMV